MGPGRVADVVLGVQKAGKFTCSLQHIGALSAR